MELYEVDEIYDENPTTTINPRLAKLLKLEGVEVGDELDLSCIGTVIEVESSEAEDGTTATRLKLELQLLPKTKDRPDQILL